MKGNKSIQNGYERRGVCRAGNVLVERTSQFVNRQNATLAAEPLSLTMFPMVPSNDVVELAVVWRDSVEMRRELNQDPICLFGTESVGLLEPWPLDILAASHPAVVRTLVGPALRHARKVK